MELLQPITAANQPLVALALLGVGSGALAIGLGLGLVAMVGALSSWWRRLETDCDPLRCMAPPVGQLRLARDLEMRRSTD